jgi:hypothetical protein
VKRISPLTHYSVVVHQSRIRCQIVTQLNAGKGWALCLLPNPEVRLDVDDSLGLEASRPATLQILVSDARQIFPAPSDVAQSVLLFGGTARFSLRFRNDHLHNFGLCLRIMVGSSDYA